MLGEPSQMVALMSTLEAAYSMVSDDDYHWETYRRLILDAHAYVKAIFEEV